MSFDAYLDLLYSAPKAGSYSQTAWARFPKNLENPEKSGFRKSPTEKFPYRGDSWNQAHSTRILEIYHPV